MTNTIDYWRNSKDTYKLLGLKGKIISFTKINSPRKDMKDTSSYFVALSELENGDNLTLEVVGGSENVKIGDKVEVILRRIKKPLENGIVVYGIKLKKLESMF